MSRVERHQNTIPYENLNLFRLTRVEQIPWVNPVSYWIPTNAEIKTIAAVAKSVKTEPKVLDVGCGNAFISHLLAAEVPVTGIDPNEELLKSTPYKHPDLTLIPATVDEYRDNVDMVVSSWMPQSINLSESIYALNPRAIIFIKDRMGFTGTKDSYKDHDGYYKAFSWIGMTSADIATYFDELANSLDPSKGHTYYTADQAMAHKNWSEVFKRGATRRFAGAYNMVDVRLREDVPSPILPIDIGESSPYHWEPELNHVYANILKHNSYDGFRLHPPIVGQATVK
ncbi:MAG: class I SAM-dependent methyltransferase [Candidatus Levybacteria bacterium]|nr:class I SAM-dependent methyltransferase [Candidatus Levybacteria bacterium]